MSKNMKRHQKQILQQLRAAIGCRCYICGEYLSHGKMTKDHVFPKAMGYTLSSNMMPSHLVCNNDKGDRIPSNDEIQLSIDAYESIGLVFNPTLLGEHKITTKHFNFFMRNLPMSFAA